MSFLVLQAYLKLIQFDIYLARKDFAALYNKVRMSPLGKKAPSQDAVDRICAAVDMACIWYWKEANAGHIHGSTNSVDGILRWSFLAQRRHTYFVVERGKILSRQVDVELNEF